MPPANVKLCECTRLCNGGRYIQLRTWYRHRKYREKDCDEEREAEYEHVTGIPYPRPRVTSAASQSRRQVRQKARPIDSGPDANTGDEPYLDVNLPSPTRTLVECDTMLEDDLGHYYPFDDIDELEAPEQTRDDANDNFPPSGQLPIDLSDWNGRPDPEYEPDVQGEEGNNGQDEEQDGAEPEDEDEPPSPQAPAQPNDGEPLPRATYPMLMLAQKMVDSIKNAVLEDDIHDPKLLHSIRHPPSENETIDQITTLSLHVFLGLVGGSEKMYQNVHKALRLSDPLRPIHSYEVIRAKVERLTGITQIQTDMCINSCIAYTGPFESLEACPKCATSRYEDPSTTSEQRQGHPAQGEESHSNSRRGVVRKVRKQYYTIPLGPQLQALWRTPEGAERMLYRQRKTNEIIDQLRKNNGRVPVYDDIFHGSEYFNAWHTGQIKQDDILLMFSIDGAQLYRDKQSDCTISIWVILDLSPEFRYKKMFILPAMFIPGPNSPDNMESFLLPAFRHVSALQKEGLRVWNGKDREYQQKRPFFFHGAADTVGIPTLNGLVGHTGSCGCRIACGHKGRRKPGQPTYYPASLKPKDYSVKGCDHADVDVATIGGPDKVLYDLNLRQLLQCTSKAGYTRTRLHTGIVRPSICSGFQEEAMIPVPRCFSVDLMHLLNLNLTQLLISIWRNSSDIKIQYGGEHGPKPDFIALDDDEVWQEHGKLVASTQPYFPSSFDRPPRNPAKKINSGFKACEYMLYFWAIGPAVFRIILPNHLWTHFCKLVCGIRAIFQRRITNEQVQVAHEMLNQWEKEFEEKYYAQEVSRLHLVRPCVHAIIHAARETVRCGPLNLVAQWALENTIGNLGREVHQHSNPFSNLAERGLLCAQMNALQAIFPEFDSPPSLPSGDRAQDLGNGYVLLFAHDRQPFKVSDNEELGVLRPLLLALGIESRREISITRWARLRLPNGQIARSAWKEIQNKNTRNSRNVKIIDDGKLCFGEVQYFFQLKAANKTSYTLALVSLYSEPDSDLRQQSFGTLWVARYRGKRALHIVEVTSIRSVVAMIPFPLTKEDNANTETQAKFTGAFYVAEKPFLEFLGITGTVETDLDANESST